MAFEFQWPDWPFSAGHGHVYLLHPRAGCVHLGRAKVWCPEARGWRTGDSKRKEYGWHLLRLYRFSLRRVDGGDPAGYAGSDPSFVAFDAALKTRRVWTTFSAWRNKGKPAGGIHWQIWRKGNWGNKKSSWNRQNVSLSVFCTIRFWTLWDDLFSNGKWWWGIDLNPWIQSCSPMKFATCVEACPSKTAPWRLWLPPMAEELLLPAMRSIRMPQNRRTLCRIGSLLFQHGLWASLLSHTLIPQFLLVWFLIILLQLVKVIIFL